MQNYLRNEYFFINQMPFGTVSNGADASSSAAAGSRVVSPSA